MGHSIIKYQDRSEVMSDTDAHLTPCLVVDTLRRSPRLGLTLTPHVRSLLDVWTSAETYWIPGGINLQLDEHLTSDSDRQCLQVALAETIKRLEDIGPVLTAGLLEQVVGPRSAAAYGDRATEKAIQALRRLDRLIKWDFRGAGDLSARSTGNSGNDDV